MWRRLLIVFGLSIFATSSVAPDGQSKFPHPWPLQILPGSAVRL